MLDIGWSEMAVIMLVALIVIGPKDLPRLAREIGRWTGKARAMARDFHRAIDDMAREAELDDLKKAVDDAGKFNPKKAIGKVIDPDGSLERAFVVDDKNGKKVKTEPVTASSSPEPLPAPKAAVEPEKAPETSPAAGDDQKHSA